MCKGLKENILKLFKEGLSYNKIKDQLKCSKGIISYYCSNLRDKKYTEEKIKLYQDYYNKCGSIVKTSKNFGLYRKTLSTYINQKHPDKVIIPKRKKINNSYRRVKQKAIEYKGGKCENCGYNKSTWALDFHHKNPEEKKFSISGGTKSFETIKKELDKCSLLCRNCHSEEHERLYREKLSYSRMVSTPD